MSEITKLVDIVAVQTGIEKEGKNGPYRVTELTYKDDGRPFCRNIFENDDPSPLQRDVATFKSGDCAHLTMVKKAVGDKSFWNITGIVKAQPGEAPKASPASVASSKRFVDNNENIARGRAMNIAASVLVQRGTSDDAKFIKDLKKLAQSVLEAEKELDKVEAAPKKAKPKPKVEEDLSDEALEDEDIDF